MSNIDNIEKAYTAMQNAHGVFSVLNDEYNADMQKSGNYTTFPGVVGTFTHKPGDQKVTGFMTDDGTFYNLVGAKSAKLIYEQTAEKSQELKVAEKVLVDAYNSFIDMCNEAALPFQFKAHKTRRGTVSDGTAGAGKQSAVLSAIHAIDKDAVVNFNGRRVFGTLSTGASFDYDVYGQSYLDTIRAMIKTN